MKTANATINKTQSDDQYIIAITVDGVGAPDWDEKADTLFQARQVAEDLLMDYCEDGECENGGIIENVDGLTSVEAELNSVMTVQAVENEFGITRDAVHKAIKTTPYSLPAMQSASTWLIRRADAEARWGNKKDADGE